MSAPDLIAEAIDGTFGERCEDFEPDCYCCQAWAQYDLSQVAITAALEAAVAKADYYAEQDYCALGYPEEGGIAASWTADMIRRDIRALVTPAQHDALAAHVAADVAKARAEDAADSFSMLIADARSEAERAMAKFPQPNYVISKFAEEAGEVVKAAIHCAENRETADNVRGEMKQAIAMLYRLWVEGDQVHGLKPLAQIGAKP